MAERVREQRRIGFAPPGIAAGRQRAERIAVIALAARDEMLALRLAALDEILPRQLDAGLDRFRAAADEIGISETARLVADESLGQRLCGLGGEEAGMGIGELCHACSRHRLDHARMLMAETGDRGAAGGVENFAAILGNQPDALAADRLRRRFAQASVHHAALVRRPWRSTFLGNILRHRGKPRLGFFEAPLRAGARPA